MANYNPKTDHIKETQWHAGESGNPKGKPKGTKHLSTWIREIMEDDSFECKLADGTLLKGAPIIAIVKSMIIKALNGDSRSFDLISKYGYGSGRDISIINNDPVIPILGGLTNDNSLEHLVIVTTESNRGLSGNDKS